MELRSQIEECFPVIERMFSPSELRDFYNCRYPGLPQLYHWGLGTWIRNNLLDPHDELYNKFFSVGIIDKDDMSSLIINLFYIYVKETHNIYF